jgi:hypothetical protein
LGGLDGAVLVAPDGLLQHLGERFGLDHVLPEASPDLPRHELPEQLNRQVPLGHPLNLGQELVGQDRDIRLLEPGRGKDVHDFVGNDGFRDDLPDGVVQFLVRLALAGPALGQDRPDRLEEPNVVADRSASWCGTERAKACDSSVTALRRRTLPSS